MDFGTTAVLGVLAAVVLTGGCVVIQSIFRISIHDKIQSFGQLRTLGATKKQIMRMVKKRGAGSDGLEFLPERRRESSYRFFWSRRDCILPDT